MARRFSPRLILALFGMLVVVLLFAPWPGKAYSPSTRAIHIDATQFAFAPGRVQVQQGDRVILKLTASDVVHGFYLDGYGLQKRIEPGVTEEVTFTADRPGKFRYRCAVSCGPLHPFMIGELIVEANTPYWRALALVLVAALGMLTYLWQTGKYRSYQEVLSDTCS
jgi:heme/copper-type cytochrome/quinol oxidase subunit 2